MKPDGHKTVQARIPGCAWAIGWAFVSGEAAEQRRGFDPEVRKKEQAEKSFDGLTHFVYGRVFGFDHSPPK